MEGTKVPTPVPDAAPPREAAAGRRPVVLTACPVVLARCLVVLAGRPIPHFLFDRCEVGVLSAENAHYATVGGCDRLRSDHQHITGCGDQQFLHCHPQQMAGQVFLPSEPEHEQLGLFLLDHL